MEANNGKMIALGIGAYQVIKAILNSIIGGLALIDILVAIAMLAVFVLGIKYSNYVCGAIIAIVAVAHLGTNIANISSNLIYLIEGVIDIVAAVLLFINSDVKAYFSGGESNS